MEGAAENDLVTKAFLAQALGDLERRMDQHMKSSVADSEKRMIQRLESSEANLNVSIANAQAKTLNWMVAIFLAATALIGTSMGVFTMVVLARP